MIGNDSWNVSDRWLGRLPLVLEAFLDIGPAKFRDLAEADLEFTTALRKYDGIEPERMFEQIQRDFVVVMALTVSHAAGHLEHTQWEDMDTIWRILLPALKNQTPEATIVMALLSRPLPFRCARETLTESHFLTRLSRSNSFGLSLEQAIECTLQLLINPPATDKMQEKRGHTSMFLDNFE